MAADDDWVAGSADVTEGTTGEQNALLYHWDGRRWTRKVGSDYLSYTTVSPTVGGSGVWIVGNDESLTGYESRTSSQLLHATAAATSLRVTKLVQLASRQRPKSQLRINALLDTGETVWTAGDIRLGTDKWDDFPTHVSPLLGRYGC